MRLLLSRVLYEKRWFIAGWSLVYGVMSALILMFYPSFSQDGGFEQVAKSLPEQLQGFLGDASTFSSLEGFITSQVYDVRMSLFLIIMTIMLAISLSVREEEDGELRTLLATPLSRVRVALEKFGAAVLIIALLNLVATAGVYVGITALGEQAPHSLLWQLYVLSVVFGVVSFSIPYSLGLATGNRSITLLVSLLIAIGGYIVTTFARAVDWLEPWEPVSLIYYYDTAGLREGDFASLNGWVLGAVLVVTITTGMLLFRRRDIA